MNVFARTPRAVPAATFARKISPVEIWRTAKRSSSTFACVPLPAPGGPRKTRRIVIVCVLIA